MDPPITSTTADSSTASADATVAPTSPFDFRPEDNVNDLQSQTFTFESGHGTRATLTGWSHKRLYARGFVRNIAGYGLATVSGLNPGASYHYKMYTYCAYAQLHYAGISNNFFVNGVAAGQTTQDDTDEPSKIGSAVAKADGTIEFKFAKSGHQVHLSKIVM